eukprot:s3609_g4.t1
MKLQKSQRFYGVFKPGDSLPVFPGLVGKRPLGSPRKLTRGGMAHQGLSETPHRWESWLRNTPWGTSARALVIAADVVTVTILGPCAGGGEGPVLVAGKPCVFTGL